MSTRYVQAGDVITYANTGSAISSGDVVPVGFYGCGVALTDIAATTGIGEVALTGVYRFTRNASDVFTIRQKVWWDASAEEVVNAPTVDTYFLGYANEAASAAAGTLDVKLAPYIEEGIRYCAVAAADTIPACAFFGGGLVITTNTTSAGYTIVLPALASVPTGVTLEVKNTAGSNAVTLDGADSETIGGGATYTAIDAANDYGKFVVTGATWQLLDPALA